MNENPLGYEKISKLLRSFAVPSITATLVSSLYNIVDQVFIGQGVGYLGNAATNVSYPLSTICLAISLLIGIGSASRFSICLGRGDTDQAAKIAGNGVTLMVLAGILYLVLGEVLLTPMLRIFGATTEVMPYAQSYASIILIGMPGTGKSVVGQALAERLGYDFVDADDLIVEAAGKTLPEILRTEGVDALLAVEGRVGQTLDCSNTVVATGGSMVLSREAMDHLRENGVVVWLETPLSQISDRMPEDLTDRGIAAPPGMGIREIYAQREALYAKYADVIVASRPGEDDTAHQVEEVLRTVGMQL